MSDPSTSRDLRLDFFRGVALIFIFIDHIPENILSYFTLEALGLCLDPLRRELLPVPMVLAAWSGPGRPPTPPRPEGRIRDTGKKLRAPLDSDGGFRF